ncbi:MAG TPA: hypothetical protein VIJ39_12320 [Solirubrobacteraceae bacterium]
MKGTRIAALALTATTLAASGCGGSTKSSSSTQSAAVTTPATQATSSTQSSSTVAAGPLTKAELITKADAICYAVNAKRASNVLSSSQQITLAVQQLSAAEQNAASELTKLKPPTSMASDWQTILLNAQTAAEATAKLAIYAHTNPHRLLGYPEYTILRKAQQQMNAIAARDGFKDCSRS